MVATSIAVATHAGCTAILAPEDERELATQGWANYVQTFQPGSLTRLTSVAEAAREPLAVLLRDLDLNQTRVGYEEGEAYEAVTYPAMHLYGSAMTDLLRAILPNAALVPGIKALTPLRSALVPEEIDQVRIACNIAGAAIRAEALRTKRRTPGRNGGFSVVSSIASIVGTALTQVTA